MRLEALLPWGLWAINTLAFRDTSPFFAYSSSNFDINEFLPAHALTASASSLTNSLTRARSFSQRQCSSDAYVLVSQPGVSASDFEVWPHLRRLVTGAAGSKNVIEDVLGVVDLDSMGGSLEEVCGVQATAVDINGDNIAIPDTHPQILRIHLPVLPVSSPKRSEQLAQHDKNLNTLLTHLSSRPFTLLFATTPRNLTPTSFFPPSDQKTLGKDHKPALFDYNNEDEPLPDHATLHTLMQRDVSSGLRKRQSEGDDEDGRARALFESYNYLSPGIFMALLATVLLSLILYVGVSAIAGLEVTYGAFAKEMGPAAGKGGKQG